MLKKKKESSQILREYIDAENRIKELTAENAVLNSENDTLKKKYEESKSLARALKELTEETIHECDEQIARAKEAEEEYRKLIFEIKIERENYKKEVEKIINNK